MVNTTDFQWKSMGWDIHYPLEDAVIREKHINAVCLRQNELPFCWMFAFCLLWAWLVPWWCSPSKAAKLVSLCLPCSFLNTDLIRHNLCQAPFFCFDLTSPAPELSPCSDWICACIQMQDWPGRDPWLNTETEMKDGLVQRMTRHPSWELDLTLLPKACTDNEP